MLHNTVKDNIRNALDNAGYSSCTHNLELLYQVYMSGGYDGNYGKLVREFKTSLRK
jgi:hypothetical protein